MKTLSKTQYENLAYIYDLTNKLFEIGLPSLYFIKAAIYAAKSVQHLVVKKYKKVCLTAIEIGEKYLRGEATKEECYEVANTAYPVLSSHPAPSVAYAAAYADTDVIHLHAAAAHLRAAAVVVTAADIYATITEVTACNMLRQSIPWNWVCSFQVAKCFGNEKDEQFIQNIAKNENLINFATILLEDENLKKQFHFFMKDYVNK